MRGVPRFPELQRNVSPTTDHQRPLTPFSMACTAVNSLQWRQLYQAIASKAYTPQFHGAHAFASHTVIHNSNTTTLRRSFHGTPSRSAVRPSRRSPSARRAKRDPPPNVLGTGSGLRLDREGFFNYILSPDVHQTLATFEQLKVLLYDTAGPMLPPGVNMTTFEHVCRQLIILSHTVVPSASVVRGISIGKFHSINDYR